MRYCRNRIYQSLDIIRYLNMNSSTKLPSAQDIFNLSVKYASLAHKMADAAAPTNSYTDGPAIIQKLLEKGIFGLTGNLNQVNFDQSSKTADVIYSIMDANDFQGRVDVRVVYTPQGKAYVKATSSPSNPKVDAAVSAKLTPLVAGVINPSSVGSTPTEIVVNGQELFYCQNAK